MSEMVQTVSLHVSRQGIISILGPGWLGLGLATYRK